MSLPSYRVRDDEEAHAPLLSAGLSDAQATQGKGGHNPPSYPPPEHLGSSSAPPDPGSRPTVTYLFKPRYPFRAGKSTVLGILGRSKEETIAIVQRGIPILADFPRERIILQVSMPYHAKSGFQEMRWVTIMDESWHRFQQEPPTEMRVLIADTEETLKARRDRCRTITKTILAYIIGATLGILFCIWIFR